MYKFNFLNKINLARKEAKKRARIITSVFMGTIISIVVILGLLFLQSRGIAEQYSIAKEQESKLQEKYQLFRKKNFFSYKIIQHVYNELVSRKKITSIMGVIEDNIDSMVVIKNFNLDANLLKLRFTARSTGSKSELMIKVNDIKNSMNEQLIALNYVSSKTPIQLERGPDVLSTYPEFQYWTFDIEVQLQDPK